MESTAKPATRKLAAPTCAATAGGGSSDPATAAVGYYTRDRGMPLDNLANSMRIFLGSRMECAQCHDHKYDPFTQRDFYQLYAFFYNVPEKGLDGNTGNAAPFIRAPRGDQAETLLELGQQLAALKSRWIEPNAEADSAQVKWEAEALKHLPLILEGGRPPRYAAAYGGIDAFNAQMTELKRGLSLAAVLRELEDTHRRLVAYLETVPEAQFSTETRFRRRLRLDTYRHYPLHASAIRAWRER